MKAVLIGLALASVASLNSGAHAREPLGKNALESIAPLGGTVEQA